MRDTTPAAEKVRLAAVRRLEPAERLRQVFELSEAVRRLALARLRERHAERTAVPGLKPGLGAPRQVLKDAGAPPFKAGRCGAPPSRRFSVGTPDVAVDRWVECSAMFEPALCRSAGQAVNDG